MLQTGMDTLTFIPGERSITAQATNVNVVYFSRAQLSLDTFFALDVRYYNQWEGVSIPDLESWEVNLDLPTDRSTLVDLPLAPDQQPLATGVYYFDIQAPDIENSYLDPHPFLAVVSPLNVMMKRSVDEVFLWAVDLQTETPAAGKEFIFYDEWMNPIAQAVTGADGSCRIALPEYIDPSMTVFALTGQPGDEAFGLASDGWTYETSAWYFGVPSWPRVDSRRTYVYTDRPIYRPGDTVYFRVVMRDEAGGGYAAPPSGQAEASMLGGYQSETSGREEIGLVNLSLSSYGTAVGEITLPEDAVPGTYTLTVGDETARQTHRFSGSQLSQARNRFAGEF